jgi:hypothetical protein
MIFDGMCLELIDGKRFGNCEAPGQSVGRDRTEVVSYRCPQMPKPVLAGAAVGKARSGDEYPAGTIDPKLMAATAMPIELVASIEEGAFHFGIFHCVKLPTNSVMTIGHSSPFGEPFRWGLWASRATCQINPPCSIVSPAIGWQ